jgi:hypothetical protein
VFRNKVLQMCEFVSNYYDWDVRKQAELAEATKAQQPTGGIMLLSHGFFRDAFPHLIDLFDPSARTTRCLCIEFIGCRSIHNRSRTSQTR